MPVTTAVAPLLMSRRSAGGVVAELAAGLDAQRALIDPSPSIVAGRAVAGQHQRASALLDEAGAAGGGDGAGQGQRRSGCSVSMRPPPLAKAMPRAGEVEVVAQHRVGAGAGAADDSRVVQRDGGACRAEIGVGGNWNTVPAEIVGAAAMILVPERTSVPAPVLLKPPPETTPLMVRVWPETTSTTYPIPMRFAVRAVVKVVACKVPPLKVSPPDACRDCCRRRPRSLPLMKIGAAAVGVCAGRRDRSAAALPHRSVTGNDIVDHRVDARLAEGERAAAIDADIAAQVRRGAAEAQRVGATREGDGVGLHARAAIGMPPVTLTPGPAPMVMFRLLPTMPAPPAPPPSSTVAAGHAGVDLQRAPAGHDKAGAAGSTDATAKWEVRHCHRRHRSHRRRC